MIEYLFSFIILIVIGMLYDRLKHKIERDEHKDDYELVRKYLLNDNALKEGKPIIWVHLNYEINARKWLNFGSRNTKQLNENYKYITIQSIINQAKGNFNVCLIDDESFMKLLPGWNIDLNQVANPMKTHLRNLAIVKLLYYYGGMRLPSSYLALKDLTGLYDTGLENTNIFIGETINRNITNTQTQFFVNHTFMGCTKNHPVIKDLMLYLEQLNSKDFTNEQDILGLIDRKCYQYVFEKKMNVVDGRLIGVKNEKNEAVLIDHLLESSYIDFDTNLQGIYIADNEILKRTKYEWFPRMSTKQLYQSNIILGKYLLLSNNNTNM
jgi:hypothetical protein